MCENGYVYTNFAPDVRYVIDGKISNITIVVDKMLYGMGHDFGRLEVCEKKAIECYSLGYMGVRYIPLGAKAGDYYKEGEFEFYVKNRFDLNVFGKTYNVVRIDVKKLGSYSNSYFYNDKLGVIAIIVQNFDSKNIPESIYFLKGEVGLFAK